MARTHPYHHAFIGTASAFVGGMLLFVYMAILAMLHDCSSVLTNLPDIHH